MNFTPTITAVLGGTNTGKTHYAVERMLARSNGVIGLPLRLLAREVYERAVREKGATSCALITGEEKIIPTHARYLICTAEAMPMDDIRAGKFASVVIDEVQMLAHKERGHIFTDRLLHARGTEETLLLGANTARPLIEALVPDARFMTRERFSVLSYTGHTKLSRLPKRTVVVAFSAGEVYALAELMRRNYGGAALVMGSLSPRTRNAQAALYQSGEVDYMVATDAIGMGLNLDADHVAFASLRKFDGERRRYLTAAETAQIAGRAGRFRNDGSFGTTGSCLPLDDDIIARIENNAFMPEQYAEWRSTALDYTSIEALKQSLAAPPKLKGLRRIAPASDETALARLCNAHDIHDYVRSPQDVKLLWDICQIPDFPDLGPEAHARLLDDIHTNLRENNGKLSDAYLEQNIRRLDVCGGTLEMLSSRLANIRTWRYIAHKSNWLDQNKDWIKQAQTVEHRLSDALHTKLVDKFVDRRTSVLLKGIGENLEMDVTVTPEGQVITEGQTIGELNGLIFTPAETKSDLEAKAINQAAKKALAPEIDRRLIGICGAEHRMFFLSPQTGELLWNGSTIGKISKGDTLLKPNVELLSGELGSDVLLKNAQGRLADFVRLEIAQKLSCIQALQDFAQSPTSYKDARALAHVMYENHGSLDKRKHHKIINDAGNTARGYIVGLGGAFGFYFAYMRDLMKPGAARLLSTLFIHAWEGKQNRKYPTTAFLPANGLTSLPNQEGYSEEVLNMAGYTRRGPRIIRFDILNRLGQLLNQARGENADGRFVIKKEMLALLGCSYEDFKVILKALKYTNVTQKFTKLQETAHKEYVLAYFARKEAIQKAQESGEEYIETPPLVEKAAGPITDKNNPGYVPKRQRVKPLNDHILKPELDEDGNPIFQTHMELWYFGRTKKAKNNTSRYRPSKQGSNDPDKNSTKGPSSGKASGRSKRGQSNLGMSNQEQSNLRQTGQKPSARKSNVSGYANYAAAARQGAQSNQDSSSKRQNKRRKPTKNIHTPWTPPRQTQTASPENSPFAALAGLKFDDPKTDKPNAKKLKSKDKKT